MVKTLYLLRHGKSSWQDPSLADFDRPLNDRGRRAGRLIGEFLARADLRPAFILCSAARRTRETLDLILAALEGDIPTRIDEQLYLASRARLLRRIAQLDDAFPSAMVIAHHPGIPDLALALAAKGEEEALTRLKAKYPTAALAVLISPAAHWRDVRPQGTRLEAFVRPKDLR